MGIATGIDKLLDIVQKKKKITIKEAAEKLKISNDKIETWGRILSDENLLELNYPANPLEPPFLQVYGYEDKKKKKDKKKDKDEPKKKDKKIKRSRKIKPRAFFRRFKNTSKRRKEFKTYKEKKKEMQKISIGRSRKLDITVKNHLKLLAIVVALIFLLMAFFGFFDGLLGVVR